jgi:hypothetical protein
LITEIASKMLEISTGIGDIDGFTGMVFATSAALESETNSALTEFNPAFSAFFSDMPATS